MEQIPRLPEERLPASASSSAPDFQSGASLPVRNYGLYSLHNLTARHLYPVTFAEGGCFSNVQHKTSISRPDPIKA